MEKRTKVKDLASELALTIDELRAYAKDCGFPLPKDPGGTVKFYICEKIRKHIEKRRMADSAKIDETSQTDTESGTDKLDAGENGGKASKVCNILEIGEFERNAAKFGVLIHKDVLNVFYAESDIGVRRRMSLIAQQLAYSGRSHKARGIAGPAKGWRRAPCAGNHGKQFYLYWAPKGAQPVHQLGLADNEVVLRIRRHHDDTQLPLDAGKRDDYRVYSPAEFDKQFGTALNDDQLSFIKPAKVGILKGHPGSGKTTTLWELAARLDASDVLYLTFSGELRDAAVEFFDSLGNSKIRYNALTFNEFYAQLAGDLGISSSDPLNEKTRIDRSAQRLWEVLTDEWKWDADLLPWKSSKYELYAELHSNIFGRALPVAFRERMAAENSMLPEQCYTKMRDKELSKSDIALIMRIGARLVRENLHLKLFQEPAWAFRLAENMLEGAHMKSRLSTLDAAIVDEIQDLTLIEQFLLLSIIKGLNEAKDAGASLYVTGDEGQSVRPTDFIWGEFGELAHKMLGAPFTRELRANVRCPSSITKVINNSWNLYGGLSKADKPQGYSKSDIEEIEPGKILYCAIRNERERDRITHFFKTNADVTMVYPGHLIPDGPIKEVLKDSENLLTADQAKGLEYPTVAVLDAGKSLIELDKRLKIANEKGESQNAAFKVWARNLIDSYRVAISRSTDTLVLLDTAENLEYSKSIVKLCGDIPQFNQLDAQMLLDAIKQEEMPKEDIARKFAEQARRIIEREPFVALRYSKNAISKLQRTGKQLKADERKLREDVYTTAAESAFALARQKPESMYGWTRDKLITQASNYLNVIGYEDDATAISRLEACLNDSGDAALVVKLSIASQKAELTFVKNACDSYVIAWLRSSANERISKSPLKNRQNMIDAAIKLKEIYSKTRGAEIAEYIKTMKLAHADRLKDERDYAAAETIYIEYGVKDKLAACKEKRGHNPEAARIYEEIGQDNDALRCFRKDALINDALRIAKKLDDPSFGHLSTLKGIHDLLKKIEEQHSGMTESERRLANSIRKAASMDELAAPDGELVASGIDEKGRGDFPGEILFEHTERGSIKKSYNMPSSQDEGLPLNRRQRRQNKKQK